MVFNELMTMHDFYDKNTVELSPLDSLRTIDNMYSIEGFYGQTIPANGAFCNGTGDVVD